MIFNLGKVILKSFFIVLLTMILTLLAACKENAIWSNSKMPKSILMDVRIAYTNQPQSALIHIAESNGYFKEEGVNLISVKAEYGKLALQEVLDDRADIATVAETPIMFSVLEAKPISVLATMVTSNSNNVIIARRDLGITKFNDLIGKKIGYTPMTTSDFYLDSLLTANGLLRKDILPIALKPKDLSDAILNKKVDAIVYWNYPLAEVKKLLGKNAIEFYDIELYTETFNLVSKSHYAKNNIEVIKKVLNALMKAQDHVENMPRESSMIMAQRTKHPLDIIAEAWSNFNFNIFLDNTIIIALEDEARWAIKNGYTKIKKTPNFSNIIDGSALEALKPQLNSEKNSL